MNLKLPESIVSGQDLKATILEIQQYSSWFLQTAIKNRYSPGGAANSPPLSETAATLIKGWDKEQQISKRSLDELIAALSTVETSAPSVTITLAAAPPGSLKQELASWFRQNVDANVLVNFKFNSTILGGMVVSYGSHTFDWSFRRLIMGARQHFPEVLRHV